MNAPSYFKSRTPEAQPVLTLGKGLPTEIEGHPVYYRRKEVAPCGDYVHRGTREQFDITDPRIDQWKAAFDRRLAKGIKPYLLPKHIDPRVDPDARDTLGYVVGVDKQGDSMYATLQVIGDEALKVLAKNDVSICIAEGIDAEGNYEPEFLHHIAFTPDSAISNLGGYVKLAASAASGAAIEAPIYEPAARSTPMLKPELLQKLRTKFSTAADASEESLIERAIEKALADPPPDKTAEVVALSAKVTDLQGKLTAAESKVLSLSAAAPKEEDKPNALSLSLIGRAFKTDREQVIASGVVSEAGMKEIDTLCGVGQNAGVALSLSAGGTDPFYTRLCEILRRNPGIKTNNAVERGGEAYQRALALSAGTPNEDDPAAAMEAGRKQANEYGKQRRAEMGVGA